MKLKPELQLLINLYRENLESIKAYAKDLKMQGGYKDFETRLAWDIIWSIAGRQRVYGWYDKYDCLDSHVETLGKTALKIVMEAE